MHLFFTHVSKVTKKALILRNQLKNSSSKQSLILKSKRLLKHISVKRSHVNSLIKYAKLTKTPIAPFCVEHVSDFI